MAKPPKSETIDDLEDGRAEAVGRRPARLRRRAAWMYYVEEMTQNAIAESLGVGRVTVTRLLADARTLNEVKISLRRDLEELPRLESALEKHFGLEQAIVAPLSSPLADPTPAIGAVTGQFVSEIIRPEMRMGVGWGRTLLSSLTFIDESQVPGFAVVSMLGGISAVRQYNPAEFAWRFSRLFHADCYLIAAPALVDCPETKQALIERCGIGPVLDMAAGLDAVVVSIGSMATDSTVRQFDLFSDDDLKSLADAGAVGDVLFNFFDINGNLVDHPINHRVMSVSVEQLQKVPMRLLTSGGEAKVPALLGGLRLLKPNVLVTDEVTAKLLLKEVEL